MEAASHAASSGAPERARLLRSSKIRYNEIAVKIFLIACAVLSIATTVGIIVALAVPTIQFFTDSSIDVNVFSFLTGTEWSPLFADASFGVLPLIVGTLVTTFWAVALAIPLGLGAGIYLSEYATPRRRKALKPALEVLAGIPTVVYGFFALLFVTPLLKDIGLPVEVFNALAAGLVMGVMILPLVASLSDDAMSAVPQGLREGAYGLGASRMQVATRVVVPAALSGIVASFVLAISRAVGETMIVLVAAGNQPTMDINPFHQVQTLAAYVAAVATGDVPTGSVEYKTIFAVGSTLFLMTLVLNAISIRLVRRFREVYE